MLKGTIKMKVYISGSHGLVGSALVNRLKTEQHEVIRISRTFDEVDNFTETDAVIHLAGESIAEGRWSSAKKKRIENSRVGGTQTLATRISSATVKPAVFISASAIGFYGDRADEKLSESSAPGQGFLPDVCKKWEEATNPAIKANVRVVHIRTGIVLDAKGGALHKMLPPFKMGGGGILGNGKQYMSWISLADMVNAILFIISNPNIKGPVNLVSPKAVINYKFTKELGTALHRPTVIPLPSFAARILFGEMADALLLSSTRVEPVKLLENGYKFKHADIASALKDILE
ncbi:TIGR01777 family oxidoreductase [Pontiellaceae bacterium B1224]|nr:TIGR01777 family oxidoreductase [Pontiellaceae bacterium B1224]